MKLDPGMAMAYWGEAMSYPLSRSGTARTWTRLAPFWRG